jgi:geranylgeranyl pyrophosphate synthase
MSLIHDDLPAMDDDDLRRGQPTCHKAFSEATAILAGDALQTLAFDCITEASTLSANTRLALLKRLGQASGHRGMVMGQAIDLASIDKQVDLNHLQTMHNYKTGALIEAAVLMGAEATETACEEQFTSLTQYAKAIGLAFQVQDDILDVIADTETLGKTQGADQERNKPTYVSLLGLEGAKTKANDLHQQALKALGSFDEKADTLRQLSAYIINRGY